MGKLVNTLFYYSHMIMPFTLVQRDDDMFGCICSAQSRNWYNSRIVLRKVGILTLLPNSRMMTVQF